MKFTGIIPARMNSVRFPGKALADILGTPMVVRVWETAKRCGMMEEVYVATDSPAILSVCRERGIPVRQPSSRHLNPTSRTAEAASLVDSDFYVMIGGDEPLLSPEDIRQVITAGASVFFSDRADIPASTDIPGVCVVNAMAPIPSMEEAADPSNIKLRYNEQREMIAASRSLLSAGACTAPAGSAPSDSACCKFVSIGIYSKNALNFFTAAPAGSLELSEHFDLLRFTEHGKKVQLVEISGRTLSVDTPSDLETVKRLLSAKKENHQIETKV